MTSITAEDLRALGVRGLLLDVDNTLTTHGSQALDPAVLAWLRAMEAAGWLTIPEGGTAAELTLVDAGEIPDWALASYLAFDKQGLGIFTQRSTGETAPV